MRQAVYLYDTHLSAGESIDLPSRPGFDRWLYVFAGKVSVGKQEAGTHTALMMGADTAGLEATTDSDLVLFLVDRTAKFSREGTMSG